MFGKKGSGKSTYLVKQMVKYQRKGYTIYTNMGEVILPNVRIISAQDIGDFIPEPKSLLCIDEVGMIWDSRKFKDFKDSTRDFFKLQRHYHVICLLASQTYDVDKKLRDLADSMVLINHVTGPISLNRPIRKAVVLTESSGDQESRISENLKFTSIFSWGLTWIPKYAKWFNSFDVPEMPYISYENPKPIEELPKKKTKIQERLEIIENWLKNLYIEYILEEDKEEQFLQILYIIMCITGLITVLLVMYLIIHKVMIV